jgi:2,3-bisphosphoglycerate-independent phosphoglycerate mutase
MQIVNDNDNNHEIYNNIGKTEWPMSLFRHWAEKTTFTGGLYSHVWMRWPCGSLRIPENHTSGLCSGSEIANMSLLGYDVRTQFEGRAPLEAASMGIEIPMGYMAAGAILFVSRTAG